ncbi:four helix bundle protein [Aridibaculum aurantiacum]|uniref:four helix bundle protein n=1 Tax=Aridibaculum aurantiacum TaxID=2810307 RepID=UPI001A97A6D6|nr:four helix bundle protein [Aridibaculum aurantiacum]
MMNEKKNILKDKSFHFAVRIYKLFKYLNESKKEFVLSKQLLRSGTSIGANIREAYNASSKADFINKLSIAQKEADESIYWLELLKEVDLLTQEESNSIYGEAVELLKMIRSSIMTAKKNIQNISKKTV